MVVMYGRRRVGKTTLISNFIKDKRAMFFSAQEANDRMNITLFSKTIFTFFQMSPVHTPFETWNDAFAFIADKAKTERFILAIDEFPYAAEANKSLKSIFQNAIDHQLKDTQIFIILCGSQINFMENEVLGYKSPLFGRRTSQMKIQGFDYLDAAKMLEGFGLEDKIKMYACIGGTPHYLAQVDNEKSFEENIYDLYFDISGYLYDEPTMLLKQELREPAMYNSIIAAIAGGASRLNEIATKIGEERSKTIKYLDTLIHLNILHKEHPFGHDPSKSKKGIYKISDNCYGFW
jgi:AAA+ ATPase superfamily predicted ATPase